MKMLSSKMWFSADELASLALPGLPCSKRRINARIAEESWADAVTASGDALARKRSARGGGMEYHVSLLPASAKAELVRRGVTFDGTICDDVQAQSQLWLWFDKQTEKTKSEAHRRLQLVQQVQQMEDCGVTRSAAVAAIAASERISGQTVWNWLRLIAGIDVSDWLPCLAPRHKGGGAKAEIDAEIWREFLSDYLRSEKPTLSSCYRRASRVATERGVAIPSEKSFMRKLEREVDKRVVTMRREGAEALRQSIPAQQRSIADLHAMQLVNIDGHKADIWVRFPDGVVRRPLIIAIQDVYSRKMLAWRIGETESAVQTRLAFADLFQKHGIPKGCLLDNGRAFASKWITGGAATRFRFKIKEDDPYGLLPSLSINPHWATPYRGQSKPIERAFRDICDNVWKSPAFSGAYTGNRPDAKPENYGSRAIELSEFTQLFAEGVSEYNSRLGRRTEAARGRSFDEAFAESYARAPIGKATEEQLRLALLTAEQLRVDRRTGEIRFMGNRYWSPVLSQHHGQEVVVRFDPDDLHQPLHVYDRANRFIVSAELVENAGFLDVASAKKRARIEKAHRRATREQADALHLLDAADLAARQSRVEADEPELPEPRVVRAVRPQGRGTVARKIEQELEEEVFADRFARAAQRLRAVE